MKIQELQDRLYEMLLIIDQICRRNNVTYWMHGGSTIGAVREHGFIPWDDDLDILVLTEDYERFKYVMNSELPEHLRLIEPVNFSPMFYDYTIRIIDDRYRLRNETAEDAAYRNYQNSVCIDVFLLSGCPRPGIKQKIWFFKYDILYGMAMSYRHSINYSKYSTIQKIEVFTLRFIGRMIAGKTPNRIIKMWYKYIFSCEAAKTGMRMVANTAVHCYWRPMPDEWFQGTVFMRFRSIDVPVPKEYDKELTFIFGDYMTPVRDSEKYITHLNPEDLLDDNDLG